MLSQLASELNTGLMPNPAVSGTHRSNDLPVAAGHLHVPGRSDNLIFVSLVITVKQTHSTHGIYFLSLAEVAGDFFFCLTLSVYLPVKTGSPEAAKNLKAPTWDKFLQNRYIISYETIELVLP